MLFYIMVALDYWVLPRHVALGLEPCYSSHSSDNSGASPPQGMSSVQLKP